MAITTSVSRSSLSDTILKLPHPSLNEYSVEKIVPATNAFSSAPLFRINLRSKLAKQAVLPELHSSELHFSEPIDLKSSELPAQSNNSAWARARRSPCVTVTWQGLGGGAEPPTIAQAWLLLYLLFTTRPSMETVRIELHGKCALVLAQQMRDVLLAVGHAHQTRNKHLENLNPDTATIVCPRSTFWQGAGSPFGSRPVWCPQESPASLAASHSLIPFPLTPLYHTMTVSSAGDPQDPDRCQQAWHPIRPAKPAPGAIVYSRWIPHLGETFSMISLDWQDHQHLQLFHEWQNDPRVSQGWNETGTVEQHREYLRKIHEDPHQLALLARWDDNFFAYFEVYWAKVSL